jgi:methylthioribose-1-phosphate isomerase
LIELAPVRWAASGDAVEILDQTRLPETEVRLQLGSALEVADAIRAMSVRGAPAIGIAAAMGLALELSRNATLPRADFLRHLDATYALLLETRPTAVNLRWALDRLRRLADSLGDASNDVIACELRREATAILDEDRAMCRHIGEHALVLVPEPEARVLTHCNAGALATAGIGTATAPLYLAHEAGRRLKVFVDETRPLLQGSRLTAWELSRAGIDVTLLPDSAPAVLMQRKMIDMVIVGADRIAANGDVANKLGTYGLAVLARQHGVPFYVAAPTSTIDPSTPSGAAIPIEHRDADEVRRGFGKLTAPADAQVFAPAFDVTPASLITAIVTDRGVLRPPYETAIADLGLEASDASPSRRRSRSRPPSSLP